MNFLEVYTNRGIAAQYDRIATDLGGFADLKLSEINPVTRAEIDGMGLSDIWDFIRSKAVKLEDGRKLILPTVLDELTDIELKQISPVAETRRGANQLRRDLKRRMRAAFAKEAHNRVIVPTASTDPKSMFQLRPGTPGGEIGLQLSMFKSFPAAFWKKLIAPALANNKSAFAAYLGLALPMGMTGLWMKDLLNGESPRPFFNLDGEYDWNVIAKNWAGLLFAVSGIPLIDRMLAEIFSGHKPRSGSFAADLAGPGLGYATQTMGNAFDLIAGTIEGDPEKAGKGGSRLVLGAPIISPLLHSNIFGRTTRNMVDNAVINAFDNDWQDRVEDIAEKSGKQYYQLPNEGDLFIEDLSEKGFIR